MTGENVGQLIGQETGQLVWLYKTYMSTMLLPLLWKQHFPYGLMKYW